MVNPKDLIDSLDEQNEAKQNQADKETQLETVRESGNTVASAVTQGTDKVTSGLKDIGGSVQITNQDLAKSSDVDSAVEAINKLNLTTFMQNEGLPRLAQNLSDLSDKTEILQSKLENEGLKKMSDQLGLVVKKLDEVSKTLSKTEVSVDAKLQKTIDNLSKSIGAIDFSPSVNVSAPDTKVITTPVDLRPVLDALSKVEKAIGSAEAPEAIDMSPVTSGLQSVVDSITALRFPVPNYVLPFRNSIGKAAQLQLNSDDAIPTSGILGGAAYDYVVMTNADGNGNYQTMTYKSGGSGGTIVRTLSYTYDGSNNVTSITRS
jgi:hypothetical protein